MRYLSLLALSFALTSGVYAQDLKLPSLSPTTTVTQEFSTSKVELTYSRPSMRGRKIFGDVVPFGQVWRTGANGATKIKFGEDVTISGNEIKAGEYALYTIPGAAEWTVILNKGTGNWGAMGYETSGDVARFKITPKMSDKNTQTFTINMANITFNTFNLELAWEKTKVVIPVKANNEERLITNIDKAINTPNIPYFASANYLFEINHDLDKAYSYVTKATEANPKAFYMWNLQARIAQKLGKKQEAIAAAQKSIETSKGQAAEAEYTAKGNKIIAEVKKS